MSTQTLTQQVQLVNIISLAEDRLSSNFRNIVNRLRRHDQQFQEHSTLMKNTQSNIYAGMQANQQKMTAVLDSITGQIQNCCTLIAALTEQQAQHARLIQQCEERDARLEKQMADMGSLWEVRLDQGNQYAYDLNEKLKQAQAEIKKTHEEILKKEDSTEVLKIAKEVENTKEKMVKSELEYKHLQHKLEKMEILNQKAERIQSKKQLQLLKQIDERIRKQLKNIQKVIPGGSRYSSPGFLVNQVSQSINDEQLRPNNISSIISEAAEKQSQSQKLEKVDNRLPRQSIFKEGHRMSFHMEDDEVVSAALKSSAQKIGMSKLNQKIVNFESKIKALQETVHVMNDSKKCNKKPEDDVWKEKFNQIRPELIKIWAKCDTLDDRIVFNERKIQEKNRQLTNIIDGQKQNGFTKLDEKLKSFQTEIYAALKQLKTKVQGKVNTQDYEKQSLALEQRLKQISELIYLKSDKLQVKKALLFLESKIKEIILVISEDEENEKDALLTKKQLKCMSCDKDIEKMSKFVAGPAKNWDALPMKDTSPELLGKFGMTGFGSLAKKLKKLESKDLPILKSKKNNLNATLQPIDNKPETE